MRAAVAENLPVMIELFIKDQGQTGVLNNFEVGNQHGIGYSVRQTALRWPARTEIPITLSKKRFRRRLHRNPGHIGPPELQAGWRSL